MSTLIICILFSLSFLALFAIGELLFHKVKLKSEYTRKLTHIGGALITLLFPIYLPNHWTVLILSSLFGAILFITDKYDLLKSVHSVKRVTFGGFLFPVAIYISFVAYEYMNDLTYFYLPVLILAFCDPAAALVGQNFPFIPIKLGKETKTVSGFMAFIVLSIAICFIWYGQFMHEDVSSKSVLIFTIAIVTSIVEFLSKKGIDNVSIPAIVLSILFLFDKWNL